MDATRLAKHQKQLLSTAPLIGKWLQRGAVQALAGDGSPEARETLCRAVIEHDHRLACEFALRHGLAPLEQGQRALFFFLTAQWEKYESLDFDHSLLRVVYEAAGQHLRARIMARARAAGRVEWVDVVSGVRARRRLSEMSDAEWEAALAMLNDSGRREEMWRLAQEAPPRWSAPILQRLHDARWMPADREQQSGYEDLRRIAAQLNGKEPTPSSFLRCLATLEGHKFAVDTLAITPDGRVLASRSWDETPPLWNLPDGQPVATLRGHEGRVVAMAMSPDGRVLASGSDRPDHTVRLWSLPDGGPVATLHGHALSTPGALVSSPDGRVLASRSAEEGTVRLWSLPDGRPLGTFRVPKLNTWIWNYLGVLAISPDSRVLVGDHERDLQLWSLPDAQPIATLQGHKLGIRSLAISPDGRVLASGAGDSTVRLWSLRLGTLNRLPVSQMTLDDLHLAEQTLQAGDCEEQECRWLELSAALMRWRWRHDIHVEDAHKRIAAGDFDIEIEG